MQQSGSVVLKIQSSKDLSGMLESSKHIFTQACVNISNLPNEVSNLLNANVMRHKNNLLDFLYSLAYIKIVYPFKHAY